MTTIDTDIDEDAMQSARNNLAHWVNYEERFSAPSSVPRVIDPATYQGAIPDDKTLAATRSMRLFPDRHDTGSRATAPRPRGRKPGQSANYGPGVCRRCYKKFTKLAHNHLDCSDECRHQSDTLKPGRKTKIFKTDKSSCQHPWWMKNGTAHNGERRAICKGCGKTAKLSAINRSKIITA